MNPNHTHTVSTDGKSLNSVKTEKEKRVGYYLIEMHLLPQKVNKEN